MTALPLVYIHGAGVQLPAPALKQQLDQLLFGHDLAESRVAYYADVRWPPAAPVGGLGPAPAAAKHRAAREGAVRSAEDPKTSARAAAAAIVAASLAPTGGPTGLAGVPGAAGAGAGGVAAPHKADATRLAEQLYRRADKVAHRSSAESANLMAGITLPDPIFRRVVGFFASDVVDYLYGGFAEQMRAPVRAALRNGPPPRVILAHSLGTIITYDVLSEPEFAGLDVQMLVTAGCPLGIGNVQRRLRNGAGLPNPVPAAVRAWDNFADRWDPVALDQTLRGEFSSATVQPVDESVNNPAPNNHDLTGYLSVGIVRSAVVNAVGT